MFNFIYHIKNEKIRDCLWTSFNRENGFRESSKRYKQEHKYLDREFISVVDLENVYNINYGSLHQLVEEYQYKSTVHPRTDLFLVDSDCLNELKKADIRYNEDKEYVSIYRAAEAWNLTSSSVNVLCEMLGIEKVLLFETPCFKLLSVNKFIKEVKQYTTLYELTNQYIWDYIILEQYLKKKKVKAIFHSETNQQNSCKIKLFF
jgi:hypothetical protein